MMDRDGKIIRVVSGMWNLGRTGQYLRGRSFVAIKVETTRINESICAKLQHHCQSSLF